MTRSRRSTPIIGHTTARSDKPGKKIYARQTRHRVKQALHEKQDGDAIETRHHRSGAWEFPKDGKQWLRKPNWKDMRK